MTSTELTGARPTLSVVVTVVDGEAALRRCLSALRDQASPPEMEVILPYDASVAWVGTLEAEYPNVRFQSLGTVPTARPLASPAGQHELYDRRRAAGLRMARGELVAILEDRGVPQSDWAFRMVALHDALPNAVIGGAVECGEDDPLSWAVYFCDFSRYQLPLEAGPRRYVTDVNIAYKREALERTRELWNDRYHETTVHWDLQRQGETLYLSPDAVVWQHRRGLELRAALRERLEWGRLFAYTRAREAPPWKAMLYAVAAPVLPALLFLRHARTQVGKRVRLKRFVAVSSLVVLLLIAWSFGEIAGYLTRRP